MRRSARRSSSISRSSASFWRSAISTSSSISSSWSIVCLSDSAISVACATAWLMAEVSAGRKSAGLTHGLGRGGSGRRVRAGLAGRGDVRVPVPACGRASGGGLTDFQRRLRSPNCFRRRGFVRAQSRRAPPRAARENRRRCRLRVPHARCCTAVSRGRRPGSGCGRHFGRVAGAFPAAGRGLRPRPPRRPRRRAAGAARGGGRVQIGLFVRHKFSREDGGFARKCNGELRLLFHKQRQRGGVAVQEILLADGADFAVAEKSGQAGQVEMRLHEGGVVAGPAKKIFAAAVAAKQAAAVNRPAGQFLFGAARAVRSCPRRRRRRRGAETGWSGPCAAARRRPARRNWGRRRAGCARENRRDEIRRGIR